MNADFDEYAYENRHDLQIVGMINTIVLHHYNYTTTTSGRLIIPCQVQALSFSSALSAKYHITHAVL